MAVADYSSIIDEAARKWNVDPTWVKAVMHQETGGNRFDRQGRPITSSAGAGGLMQIMPGTARDLGVSDPHDPVQAIFGGAQYLRQMLDKYGDVTTATAAYNAGPAKVDAVRAGRDQFKPETVGYVPAVASHYRMFAGQNATPAKSAKATAGGESVDDFLKRTAAPDAPQAESVDDFLKRTAAPDAPQAASAPARAAAPMSYWQASDAAQNAIRSGARMAGNALAAIPGVDAAQNAIRSERSLIASGAGVARRHVAILAATPGALGRIAGAAGRGAVEGFGSEPSISSQVVNKLAPGIRAPAALGMLPVDAVELALRAGSGLFRGAQGAVAQTGAEVGEPILGRDLAAIPEAFMGAPNMLSVGVRRGAPANRLAPVAEDVRAVASPMAPPLPEGFNPLGTPAARAAVDRMVPAAEGAAMPIDARRSVGAAGTPLDAFGRSAREIKGQAADMELADLNRPPTPGKMEPNVPGVQRIKSEIELNPDVSKEAKALRQEFRGGFNEIEQANNELYHTRVQDVAGTREQVATLKDAREAQWKLDEKIVFGKETNGAPVSSAPVVDYLKSLRSDPIEKYNSYASRELKPFMDALVDEKGNPRNLGAKELYGLRREMDRKVKEMATNPEMAHLKQIFHDLMAVTDKTITTGAPDYRTMMDRYRTASEPINAMERVQKGALNITNGSDRTIPFGKYDTFMKNLWLERHGLDPHAPAKSINAEQWDALMDVHRDLKHSASDQELARTRGSDTTQMTSELLRKGIIGSAHVAGGFMAPGVANIAIPFLTKQFDNARTMKRLKNHLNPNPADYPSRGP